VSLNAGKDLELTASRISGGGNVALDAQRDVSILSALDEDASFYSKKSKGSFGRSKSRQQESYDSTNVASVVEAGKDLTVNASKQADGGMSIDGGRDVTVIGSQLKAGGDMLLGATGDIAVLSGVEEHGSYSKKTKSGFLGLSKSGKSQLKTTASQVGSAKKVTDLFDLGVLLDMASEYPKNKTFPFFVLGGDVQAIESNIDGVEKLSIIPGFNLYNLNLVLSFNVRQEYSGEDASTYEIGLVMLYQFERFEYEVGLKFMGVSRFKVPEVNGAFYLSEIELENVSADQLEGINFRFKDHGGSGFEVLSRGFSVSSCKPRD